jgi:uncharacterized protein (TIGR00297 family)
VIAVSIFYSGGIQWSIPILIFFFSSSLITKKNRNIATNKNSKQKIFMRDHIQVIANGGVGGLLTLLYSLTNNELLYYYFLASLSVVCSDTWSTEIGTDTNWNTYNILNFRRVEKGFSGGISLPGSLAGLLGSVIISISGFLLIEFNLKFFVIIIMSGILGNVLDSILGVAVQVKYNCPVCRKIVEIKNHCATQTHYFGGIRFIDNNAVNLIASISGILFFILFQKLF